MKAPPALIILERHEKLTGIMKEKYTKPRHGRAFAYVVGDRLGRLSFLGQKLPLICKVINSAVHDPVSKVSLNGMWQTADRVEGRAGPYCKGRWMVRRVDLDDVCEEYAREQAMHEKAIVVCDEIPCYRVTCERPRQQSAAHGA